MADLKQVIPRMKKLFLLDEMNSKLSWRWKYYVAGYSLYFSMFLFV